MSAARVVDEIDNVCGISRREVLQSGAALMLGFYLPQPLRAMQGAPAAQESFQPNACDRIAPDNRITLLVERPELGQGPRTVDAMMLADEMEANWSTIRVEQAPTLPDIYKNLSAGGSGGVMNAWMRLRTAGAGDAADRGGPADARRAERLPRRERHGSAHACQRPAGQLWRAGRDGVEAHAAQSGLSAAQEAMQEFLRLIGKRCNASLNLQHAGKDPGKCDIRH